MAKKTLPQIYVDEHIKPFVIEAFEECGFKCIRISNTKKYAGREEEDYIQEIYAEGRLFLTSDRRFRQYVIKDAVKHAGILQIPRKLDGDTAIQQSVILARFVEVLVEDYGKNAMRRVVFYVENDGLHYVEKGIDLLMYSKGAQQIELGPSE